MVTYKSHYFQVQVPQLILGIIALISLFVNHDWLWLISTYVFILLVYVIGEGIVLHRYFSHKAYECIPWVAKVFSIFAILGGFGGPIGYRAAHVMHHAHSDTDLDPHTPTKGLLNSMFTWYVKPVKIKIITCKSLLAQPYYVWLEKHSVHIWWAVTILLALIDIKLMLYTMGLGGLFCYISANFITNTLAHNFGSRRFETKDNSRNLWWLSWITLQGSSVMQNNHHAIPNRYHDSFAWYEIDVGKWIIPLIATKIYKPEETHD